MTKVGCLCMFTLIYYESIIIIHKIRFNNAVHLWCAVYLGRYVPTLWRNLMSLFAAVHLRFEAPSKSWYISTKLNEATQWKPAMLILPWECQGLYKMLCVTEYCHYLVLVLFSWYIRSSYLNTYSVYITFVGIPSKLWLSLWFYLFPCKQCFTQHY